MRKQKQKRGARYIDRELHTIDLTKRFEKPAARISAEMVGVAIAIAVLSALAGAAL